MSKRRHFLHVLGASLASAGASAAGLGCSSDATGESAPETLGGSGGSAGSGQGGPGGEGGSAQGGAGQGGGEQGGGEQGGAGGDTAGGAGGEGGSAQGGAGNGQGGAGQAGAGQAGAGNGGAGGSGPPKGTPIGKPSDYPDMTVYMLTKYKLLLGHDAGGYYVLDSICTHSSCDMSKPATGEVTSKNDIICHCHGSLFSPTGAVLQGPAKKALAAYVLALGDDGILYADKTTKTAATTRLAI